MVERGAGTLAISIPATLGDSRLGRQRAAFIYLGFTAIAVADERIRRLCVAAMLVEPPVWQWRSSVVSSAQLRYWARSGLAVGLD